MSKRAMLTKEEVQYYVECYKEGELYAGEILVYHFMPKILSAARTASDKHGLPFEDARQEMVIAFLKAVEKFDPSLNTFLSSFSNYFLKAAVTSYKSEMLSPVKIPNGRSTRKLMTNFNYLVHEYEKKTGNKFDAEGEEYVAETMDISVESVRQYAAITRPNNVCTHSVASMTNEGEEHTSYESEFTTPDYSEDVLVRHENKTLSDLLYRILHESYCGRDLDIATHCYLAEDSREVLAELAERFELSIERIRQIRRQSHEVIREKLAAEGIRSMGDILIAAD